MPLKRKTVREAVRQNGFAVKDVSNELHKKKELTLDVDTHNRSATSFVGEKIGKDEDVMMEAIKKRDLFSISLQQLVGSLAR